MKSLQDLALQRAQDYARDRGWRQKPLTSEEVEALVGLAFEQDLRDFATGYDDGYAAAIAKPLDRDRIVDWCADHGYKLVKEAAS